MFLLSTVRLFDALTQKKMLNHLASFLRVTNLTLIRLIGLMAAETRMMLGASFDACNVGEVTLAHRLLTDVPANSLTLFDRCYFSADLLINWQEAAVNSHWLIPIKRKLRYEVIKEYADNDMLIEMPISPQARKKNSKLPATWQAKLVLYKDPAGEIEGFITSLADPNQYPLESYYASTGSVGRSRKALVR